MKKHKIKELVHTAGEWLKEHPSALMIMGILAMGIYMQWLIVGISFSTIEAFSMESIGDVLGTSAEVDARVYVSFLGL